MELGPYVKEAFLVFFVFALGVALDFFRRQFAGWLGLLAGKWTQSIPRRGSDPPKEDRIKLHHHGERIFGDIMRHKPAEQSWKKWRFEGVVRDRSVVGYFVGTAKSADKKKDNLDSYGVIFLRKDGSDKLVGHYLKLSTSRRTNEEETVRREQIADTWVRGWPEGED